MHPLSPALQSVPSARFATSVSTCSQPTSPSRQVREPRVPNHAGYDDEVAALSRRSIVERLEGWTDDGYTKGFDAGYVN